MQDLRLPVTKGSTQSSSLAYCVTGVAVGSCSGVVGAFPAVRAGREVFLCWELAEPDITHWHDLDSGFAGREQL